MGRRVWFIVPQAKKLLFPKWAYMEEFQEANVKFKNQQKRNFDERHRGLDLPEIPKDTNVWIILGTSARQGRVTSSHRSPQSYIVDTPVGSVRRNQSQLNVILIIVLTNQPKVPYLKMIPHHSEFKNQQEGS